jgi:RNA polymerase sigma factor (sigma-70 family)
LQDKELEKRFEAQIGAHEALIRKICRMYAYGAADRQDLFQDIILQLWQAYPRFRGESKFSTWLYRVSINTAMTKARKRKVFVSYMDPETISTSHAADPASTDEMEKADLLDEAIRELNEVERAVLMLYLDDRSYEEMEEVLGASQTALRMKMSRIKQKLRELTNGKNYGDR